MLIALDYDNTYTLDKEFWNNFITKSLENGHNVICVTMRYNDCNESQDVVDSIGKYCKIYFTGRMAKKPYLDKLDIQPDVWIDDNPSWIYTNSI